MGQPDTFGGYQVFQLPTVGEDFLEVNVQILGLQISSGSKIITFFAAYRFL